jgi:hypothetical protein
MHATFALKAIANGQPAMSHRDEGSFATSSCGQSFELSGKVTVLRPHCCRCGLTGHVVQPWTALAALVAGPFACALMVAGTSPCPACQVCRTGEGCHVRSDLGNQAPGCHPLDTGNRDPAGHCASQFLELPAELLQSGVARLDLGFEESGGAGYLRKILIHGPHAVVLRSRRAQVAMST